MIPQFLLTLATLCLLAWILRQRLIIRRLRHLQQRQRDQDLRALAAARNERDSLLNAFPDAFLIADAHGLIQHCNQAAMALLGPSPFIDRTVLEVLRDARLATPYLECRNTGEPNAAQIHLPSEAAPGRDHSPGSGDSVWLVDAAPVLQATGAPHVRILLRDLSAEHQLEQIRKDFVANASHELRTPITLVDGYLETFLDAPEMLDERPAALRILGIMRKHTGRITRIIEDMLLISRMESGDASTLRMEDFQLTECVHDIIERLEPLIRAQNATLAVQFHDPGISLHGDRFYWTQILFNLIENALKQNLQPGLQVRILSEACGEGLRLAVVDNGIGIPAADLPFIFKRFYRVEKHHSQNQIKGTGLGLSIVKRAIEAHDGSITCHSAPGLRTSFEITLPRQATHANYPEPLADLP
ncbi:MAG: PAS domain-containing protein [Verrucomicrobia bacterium]|nr:MAG: PAS domain-containing protein [Verrucomicrobiota bacterium]